MTRNWFTFGEGLVSARGTFDEERATPRPCRCGRIVAGRARCQDGAPCVFEDRPARVTGRWGALWAQDGEGE